MKIAIIGDVHYDKQASSRTDNYWETCIDKLQEVANNSDAIICCGDFFNTCSINSSFLIPLVNFLRKYKKDIGRPIYTIIGNHDVRSEEEKYLNQSELGLFESIGLIQVLKPNDVLQIYGCEFITSYVNFDKCVNHLHSLTYKSDRLVVLLLHQLFMDGPKSITIDDVKKLAIQTTIKYIFLGHEHCPFSNEGVIKIDDIVVGRSGSLVRNRADAYNLSRVPFYFLLDTHDKSLSRLELSCTQPASLVFTEDAYNQTNLKKKRFQESVNKYFQEIVNRYKNNNINKNNEKFSIVKTLKEDIKCSEECFNYIKSKYAQLNLTLK